MKGKVRIHKISAKNRASFFGRTKGLIGNDRAENIFFRTRFGIHTFGMRFPIDIIILDNEMKIVKLKSTLSPSRFFWWNPIFENVIEMEDGTINSCRMEKGDLVKLDFITE